MIAKTGPVESATESFFRRTADARKVLVVDLGFLGDTIHLVPALGDLRRHFAAASLHVVTSPVGAEVLRMAACVDRTWPLELRRGQKTLSAHLRLIAGLRRERFDVGINLSAVDRSIILLALSGARQRIAHLGGREHFWNRRLIPHWIPQQRGDLPVFEQHQQALARAGVSTGPARFDLRLLPEEIAWAEQEIPPESVHVSVNASNALKEWPVESCQEMIRTALLRLPGVNWVLSGSANPREQERLDAVVAGLDPQRVRRLPAGLSLTRLAAVIARCRLHLGPDSGVIHLAMALGTPAVSLFRQRGGYAAWVPPGEEHHALLAPCTCPDDRRGPCFEQSRAACLARITPHAVLEAVERSLAQSRKAS